MLSSPCSSQPAPIGVYDSGVGGLSVLAALQAALPHERFVYIADSGFAPYGDLAPAIVLQRAQRVMQFLQTQSAKALVIACNTASVTAAESLRAQFSIPIVAMEPAIKPAVQISQSKKILVLATSNTLRSVAVARLCERYQAEAHIFLQACPGLADHVERHFTDKSRVQPLLERYIQPAITAGADTIVLGCTHYAFLQETIQDMVGECVTIIEPSAAIARQLVRRLIAPVSVQPPLASMPIEYYTSGHLQQLTHFLAAIAQPSASVWSLPKDD